MSRELPKSYDPASVEAAAYRVWTDEKCFHAEPSDPGNPYAIVIPPPNVTAALHLGHALNNTIQDILTRWRRMAGDNAVWLPGTDHAGIATQTVVERRVMAEEGKRRTDFKRDDFIARVQAWKDEYEKKIIDQLKAMGCSCDWDRQAFTMDEPRARAVREAFFRLFKDGLIYRGKRLVNWDPVTQTALADDEVEMEEVDGFFYYLRYPLTDGMGYVTVATTRPETMLGDTAVAINPKDPRAVELKGKLVKLPIVGREIRIVEDDYVVMADPNSDDAKARFASGFLKVTPAHDPNDYEIGRRHNLDVINVMAPDASISDKHGWTDIGDAGFVLGKSREDARKLIVDWFKRNGLLEEIKPYRHSVGHSYRSHVPIEPYLSDQWYCRVTDPRLAGAALNAMAPEQRESAMSEQSRDRQGAEESKGTDLRSWPLAYLITFTTYGTWLHGNEPGSVDRLHNSFGAPYLIGDEKREQRAFADLSQQPAELDAPRRDAVQRTIAEVCRHRGWKLHVVHARPTHVHVVVSANAEPERVLLDFKSYATRRLREKGLAKEDEAIWTRHGSTRYLWEIAAVREAADYVHDRQGTLLEPEALVPSHDSAMEGDDLSEAYGQSTPPLPHGRGSVQTDDRTGLRFYPARYAKTFQSWHENIRDWCISRQLWWGHRIPVWSRILGIEVIPNSGGLMASVRGLASDEQLGDSFQLEGSNDFSARQTAPVRLPDGRNATQVWVCVAPGNSEFERELEAQGFTQDPDVLDTWFSSALWPISTLNWPENSDDLEKWNPSSVLTTAREIITLWVSRMVMFNLYLRNCLPFKDVFIHAMIQDGEGQKMSKSLGNGVDPLDIIDSHGADAMRFTLAAMTTHTQDLRMPVELVDPHSGEAFPPAKITNSAGYIVAAPIQSSPRDPSRKMVSSYGLISGQAKPTAEMPLAKNTSTKFDLGRNFCNKLWNAGRFAISNLESVKPEPVNEAAWSLADRWIIARLHRTLAESDEALKAYRFDVYVKGCYDFFWRDLCDWYVEAIKPAMRDPARAGQAANVLASVLDNSLRLLHPAIPFITETIWWRLNEARPQRGLPGFVECPPSERLVRAKWPAAHAIDSAAEEEFAKLQAIIGAIRNVRNDYKVEVKRTVEVSVLTTGEARTSIERNREMIESLATCHVKAAADDLPVPANAARMSAGGCELFIEGLVDEKTQQQRDTKQKDDLQKKIKAMEMRLANEAYIAKAPQALVQQTRDELAKAKEELAKLSATPDPGQSRDRQGAEE